MKLWRYWRQPWVIRNAMLTVNYKFAFRGQ